MPLLLLEMVILSKYVELLWEAIVLMGFEEYRKM